MKTAQLVVLLIFGFFLIFSPNPISAQQKSGSIASDTSIPVGPADPAEIEAFLDDLFSQQMKDYHFAGITAAVVKDGQILLHKGYGYADLENQLLVDPAESLFRIGSVTKLFTWTAILQLYEQGKLDLDADIDTYLDFQIPDTFPEPITIKNLMSHTPGFEFLWYEALTSAPEQILPLHDRLVTHMPARVYPPGKVSAYSNYGVELAGYIVERVSGMPYADYIEANILEPLGMAHTTSRQPLPTNLAMGMSKGYVYSQNAYQLKEFQYLSTQPDGAISSTAEDMARFMIAHLQGGSLCSNRVILLDPCGSILKPATEQLMQTSLWGADPRLPGFAYGFMEWNFHGQRILYHAGDTLVFQSNLVLLPDQNLGFFYSYNTANPAVVPWDTTLIAFMQHYYPVELVASQPAPGFTSRAKAYTGNYFLARSSFKTIEKVNNLLQWIRITDSGDGALLLGLPISPIKARLEEIEPGLFREASTGLQFVFRVDNQANSVYLYDTHQPEAPFVKVPWHANPMLHYGLLIACVLIFLSTLVAGLFSGITSLLRRGEHASHPILARIARWTAILVVLLNVSALFAFLAIFLDGSSLVEMIGYGDMARINTILILWLVAAVLTIVLAALTFVSWKKGFWSGLARFHYALVTLAALAFIWFLNYWNLLGFRY